MGDLNMIKINSLRWIGIFGLLCLTSNDSYNSTTLAANNTQSVSIIAEFNRANREILNSMDCEYTRSLNTYSDIQKEVSRRNPDIKVKLYPKLEFKGRFAFDGDKVLTSENTEGVDEYYQYVKNGKQIRNAQSQNPYPRTINYGTVGIANIKPPIPDPWAHTGYPLIYRLDKLDKRNEKVISVDSKFERGKELKVVTIEQRPDVPIVITVTIDFSVQDGYLPVRVRQEITTKSGEEPEYISEQSVDKILKYNVGGNTLYLPASCHREVHQFGKLSSTSDFKIQEETVKINPDLPDDMFWVDIQPGDIVVDKDKDIQYRAPAAGVVGAPAPDFTLGLLGSNEKVTLSKVKEEVIVLDFWATWCGPCKKIHPALEAVHKWAKENNKSVAFYCINRKEESELVSEYWEKSGSDIPVLLDTDGSVFTDYKGSGIPYVIIISEGIIRNAHIGSGAEVNVLEQHIKDIIIEALEK